MNKVSVYSLYMPNISPEVIKLQKECVDRFLPEGWSFKQICHSKSHGEMLKNCVEENKNAYTIFLDIDCIPVSQASFSFFFGPRWSIASGALIGAAQRANHIKNNSHIYAGPFCMGFKNETYKEVGSPTFCETQQGDVGEELTYAWQQKSLPVILLYPSDVEQPLWNLFDSVQFGIGTTYEDLFYHSFCIRVGSEPQSRFLTKCNQILDLYDSKNQEKKLEGEVTLS